MLCSSIGEKSSHQSKFYSDCCVFQTVYCMQVLMKLSEARNSKPLPKFKTRCRNSRPSCPYCSTCEGLTGPLLELHCLWYAVDTTSHAGCRHGLRLPPEEDCLLGINMQLAQLRGGKTEEPRTDRYISRHVCQQQSCRQLCMQLQASQGALGTAATQRDGASMHS